MERPKTRITDIIRRNRLLVILNETFEQTHDKEESALFSRLVDTQLRGHLFQITEVYEESRFIRLKNLSGDEGTSMSFDLFMYPSYLLLSRRRIGFNSKFKTFCGW